MAKLRNVDLPEAKPAKKSSISTTTIDGDIVQRYAEAVDAQNRAKSVVDALAPDIKDAGLRYVFEANCDDPQNPISSVNIQDEAGKVVQYTWKNKFTKLDKATVEAAFKDLKTTEGKFANLNNYVGYEPVAEFDSGAMTVNGKFDDERYQAFFKAVGEVALKFGIANPLSVTKKLAVFPAFNALRFRNFTLGQNVALQDALPCEQSLKVQRDAEEEK